MAEIKCSFLPDYLFSTELDWSTDLLAIPINHPAVAVHMTYQPYLGRPNWADWDKMTFQAITRISEEEVVEVFGPGTEQAKMQGSLECETYLETCNPPASAIRTVFTKKNKQRIRLTLYGWPRDLAAAPPAWYLSLHGQSTDKQATQDGPLPPLA